MNRSFVEETCQKHVVVDGLTVLYDRKPVVWDVHFSIPSGALTAIIGPNGAGKSSLVKAMLGLIPRTLGKVRFFGYKTCDMLGKIAYVEQKSNIDWKFPISVFEVAQMGLYGQMHWWNRPGKKERIIVDQMLDRMGLLAVSAMPISALSGGQQRRLLIARALLQRADVYFFDEPFAAIDVPTEKFIVQVFREMEREGKTIFVVHHDLKTVREYFSFAVLLNVRLIAAGPVVEVYNSENLSQTFGLTTNFLEEAFLHLHEKEGKPFCPRADDKQ